MSEHITRLSLDAALDQDRTDWARLRGLTDAEIEAAIAADADSFALEEDSAGSATQYRVRKDKTGGWSWSLVGADGKVLAVAPGSYATRAAVLAAIDRIRSVGARADVKAA